MVHIGIDWDEILADEWAKPYYQNLRRFLKSEYSTHRVYLHMNDIFNALRYTSFENTKVVIIGQDPYHGAGQAHGLCFSVKHGVMPPPKITKRNTPMIKLPLFTVNITSGILQE